MQGITAFSNIFLLLAQLHLYLCNLNLVLLSFCLDSFDSAAHIIELKMRPCFRTRILLRIIIVKVNAFVVDHVDRVLIIVD